MRLGKLTVALITLPGNAEAQDILDDAGRSLLNADPVLGAVVLFTIAALAWVVNQWLKSQQALLTEKEAHRLMTKAHAEALGEFKPLMIAHGASLNSISQTMQQLVDAERFRGKR